MQFLPMVTLLKAQGLGMQNKAESWTEPCNQQIVVLCGFLKEEKKGYIFKIFKGPDHYSFAKLISVLHFPLFKSWTFTHLSSMKLFIHDNLFNYFLLHLQAWDQWNNKKTQKQS